MYANIHTHASYNASNVSVGLTQARPNKLLLCAMVKILSSVH